MSSSAKRTAEIAPVVASRVTAHTAMPSYSRMHCSMAASWGGWEGVDGAGWGGKADNGAKHDG